MCTFDCDVELAELREAGGASHELDREFAQVPSSSASSLVVDQEPLVSPVVPFSLFFCVLGSLVTDPKNGVPLL